MSGGNNKKFMKDPVAFLRMQIIVDPANIAPPGPRTNEFDLESVSPALCLLNNYNAEPHGVYAVPIHAHYLPAQANRAMSMRLTNNAKYMFTSYLSGCLFAAYGPDSKNVTVVHVNEHKAPGLIAARTQEILTTNYAYCRILSPVLVPGTHISTYQTGACIIGVSDARGNWSFHCKRDGEELPFPL